MDTNQFVKYAAWTFDVARLSRLSAAGLATTKRSMNAKGSRKSERTFAKNMLSWMVGRCKLEERARAQKTPAASYELI